MSVVDEGRDNIVNLLGAGLSGEEVGAQAIGSDNTPVADTQSNLGTTVDSKSGLTASANGNTMSLVATFTNNSATIVEASIYSNTSSIMLARQVVNTVNVESSDTLQVTWDINVSN